MPRLERRADADGVAERDLVAAEIPQHPRDVHHGLRLHLAVIGATEHAGDIAAYLDAVRLGSDDDWLEALNGFGDRAIDIGARKTFRGRGKYRDHPGAGRARGVVALFVRHQHVEFAAGMMVDPTQDLIRVHHLRDRLRRYERSDFDGVQPGADQRLDKADAGRDADRRLLVLQAVARANFDDAYQIAHVGLARLLTKRSARFRRVRRLPARYRRPCILSLSARLRRAHAGSAPSSSLQA